MAQEILNAAEIAQAREAQRMAQQRLAAAEAAKGAFAEQNKGSILSGIRDLTAGVNKFNQALKDNVQKGTALKPAAQEFKSAIASSQQVSSPLKTQLAGLEAEITGATQALGNIVIPQPIYSQGQSTEELMALIQQLQAQIAAMNQALQSQMQTAQDAAQAAAEEAQSERQSAFDILYEQMDSLGLAALVEPLRGLIEENVSPSEFAVRLRQTDAYKARFAANDVRLQKGLRVLQPKEYIAVEDAYRQVLRSYGLQQFDNDTYVRQFIENDVSASELSDRVSMAVQRVQNADPAISRTLRDYYGIGQADLVAYVLDPNQQLQKIQRQVAAAEVGAAARVQGIEPSVAVAEQLAAQGITQAEAQRGYATIADILPTSEKLSQIYGASMEGYDLAQAEQEVFNQLASAQRRRERLTQREIAAFSGQSGLGRTSLTQQVGGQI